MAELGWSLALNLATFYTLGESSGRLLDLFHTIRGPREIGGHHYWLLPYLDPFSIISNDTMDITTSNKRFPQRM